MIHFIRFGAGLERPARVAVDRALGADGGRGCELHEMPGLLIDGSFLARRLAQRFNRLNKLAVFFPQRQISLRSNLSHFYYLLGWCWKREQNARADAIIGEFKPVLVGLAFTYCP
jgi:hypothetical protein